MAQSLGGKRDPSTDPAASHGLGASLRRARLARGIKQGELARRLGMSVANLSRIERGADFRVSTLLDLARELRLEPILVPKESVPAVRAITGAGTSVNAAPERGRFT
jgi:transcriptional regulator with XRE-family HTH domain